MTIKTNPTLAIIGCGWLGARLIPYLQSHFQLSASTARQSSADALSIPAYAYDWTQNLLPDALKQCDYYLLAIPPSAANRNHYALYIEKLAHQLPSNANITLISSSGVYVTLAGIYDEQAVVQKHHPIYQGEQALRRQIPQCNILRCSGLFGDARLSGKQYFAKSYDLPNKRLNLVHYKDVASALSVLLTQDKRGWRYNLAHPAYPLRHDYYRAQAILRQQTPPIFTNPNTLPERLIAGNAICADNHFDYQHSPLEVF